jgi:hypothetical protein
MFANYRRRRDSSEESDSSGEPQPEHPEMNNQGADPQAGPGPAPVPPRVITPEDLLHMMGMMAQQNQQLQQAQTAMQRNMELFQQQQQQLGADPNRGRREQVEPLPKLNATTFAPLDMGGSEATQLAAFTSWESSVRNTVTALNAERGDFPFQRLAAGILGSLKGRALRTAQGFNPAPLHNLDAFFTALRTLMLGTAVADKAYALFSKRCQQPQEDLNTFHSDLRTLYQQAFPHLMNQPGGQQELIKHFVSNLHDRELAKTILTQHEIPGQYDNVRTLVLQVAGRYETFRQLYQGSGRSSGGFRSHQAAPVPMEIDAVRRSPGKAMPQQTHAVSQPTTSRGKWQPGKGKTTSQDDKGQRSSDQRKIRCFNCQRMGTHVSRECPERQVNTVMEENDEEGDEDDEWEPPASPVGVVHNNRALWSGNEKRLGQHGLQRPWRM